MVPTTHIKGCQKEGTKKCSKKGGEECSQRRSGHNRGRFGMHTKCNKKRGA